MKIPPTTPEAIMCSIQSAIADKMDGVGTRIQIAPVSEAKLSLLSELKLKCSVRGHPDTRESSVEELRKVLSAIDPKDLDAHIFRLHKVRWKQKSTDLLLTVLYQHPETCDVQ